MRSRSWTHHLTLLPGGELGLRSALITCVLVYCACFFLGLIGAMLFLELAGFLNNSDPIVVFGLANGFPCAVLGLWTGLRVRSSQPLQPDQAAVDLRHRRVLFGDEASHAPKRARVLPVHPRQAHATLLDDRPLQIEYRANADAQDLLLLARALDNAELDGEAALERFVQDVLERLARTLIPDPEGLRAALTHDLLEHGVVLTHAHVG